MKNDPLQIDLVYDIICPWCYVGHQRLRNAVLKTTTQVQINLVPYRIRPNVPIEGISIEEYWKKKGIVDVGLAYEKVKEAAENEGLGFKPEDFNTIPNTLKIHQVIVKAEENGVGLAALHAIQTAYFAEGSDLTKLKNIISITNGILTPEEATNAWNDTDHYEKLVLERESTVKEAKINSVPTLLVANQHRITGAVANHTLVDMLHQLAPKETQGESCDINTGLC